MTGEHKEYATGELMEAVRCCGPRICRVFAEHMKQVERMPEPEVMWLLEQAAGKPTADDGLLLGVQADRIYTEQELRPILGRKIGLVVLETQAGLRPMSDGRYLGLAVRCAISSVWCRMLCGWRPPVSRIV